MSSDADAAAHGGGTHGSAEHLVKMANDIGNFFAAEPAREDAVAGIANHIDKFWTKRMRAKLAAHLQSEGDTGLHELPREALQRLLARQPAAAMPAAAPPAAH